MNINDAVRRFSVFLNLSWDVVYPLLVDRTYTTDNSAVYDWLQANWELLIERKILPLGKYMEIYGDGADFNGDSSRITDLKAIATYSLIVIPLKYPIMDILNNESLTNKTNHLLFERLVGFREGFYCNYPPFNYVLVNDNRRERVFNIEYIKFELFEKKKQHDT